MVLVSITNIVKGYFGTRKIDTNIDVDIDLGFDIELNKPVSKANISGVHFNLPELDEKVISILRKDNSDLIRKINSKEVVVMIDTKDIGENYVFICPESYVRRLTTLGDYEELINQDGLKIHIPDPRKR